MINEWEILIRLVIAAALGAVIGVERERSNQPAGLRTHIILVVGSALAMTLSINVAIQFSHLAPNGDPGRIAAQVVSGIGFLGAGAIIRYGTSIRGLTTATSLWTLAVVGLVVGAGYYIAAIGTTLILLTVLYILNILERRVISPFQTFKLTISAEDRRGFIGDFKAMMERRAIKYSRLSIQKNLKRKMVKVETQVQIMNVEGVEPLLTDMGTLVGVRAYKLE